MHAKHPIDHLRLFVELQMRLWRVLRDEHSEPLTPGLTMLPKYGQVKIDSGVWNFQRHGSGVLFTEVEGARKIDLHDAMAGDDQVDAWRLATYFGSLGRMGEVLVMRFAGTTGTLEERLSGWLECLARQGVLRAENGRYTLISSYVT